MRHAALLLLLGIAATADARRPPPPPPPTGELVLDLDAPFIDATIAGVTLRLEVALDTHETVELNPDAAARLPLPYEADGAVEVGRVVLAGRQARADGVIAGRPVTLIVSTHDARCCARSDGTIGPDLLPFARIVYVRAGRTAGPLSRYPAVASMRAGLGLTADVHGEPIAIKLAPAMADTVATASATAIAVRALGGSWAGPPRALPLAFGVMRPVRPLRLARPLRAAGFRIDTMLVRTADFRGGRALPEDAAAPGEIVVKGALRASQHDWSAIVLGRAQLDACARIVVERVPALAIALDCGTAR